MAIRKEIKVGLLVISAAVVLYFGIDFLKGSDVFNSSNRYFVTYENVDGLTASNPVMLNGLQIGLIRKIQIFQGAAKPILVELEINGNVQVGDSAVALLSNNGLLGGKMIILDPGKLGVGRSTDTLLGVVEPGLASVLGDKAEPVVEQVTHLMKSVDSLASSFSGTSAKLNATLAAVEKLSLSAGALVDNSKDDLSGITHNIELLSSALLKTEKDLEQILKKVSILGDSLTRADLAGTVNSLHQTTEQLAKTMTSINEGKGTMGKLMKSDSLYRNLNASSASLNELLKDMKANPKRYVHFSVFGSKTK